MPSLSIIALDYELLYYAILHPRLPDYGVHRELYRLCGKWFVLITTAHLVPNSASVFVRMYMIPPHSFARGGYIYRL